MSPWRIENKGGSYCVVKKSDRKLVKCHPTRRDAQAHMDALYAAENKRKESEPEYTLEEFEVKETSELDEKCIVEYHPYYGATSFAELDEFQGAQKAARHSSELTYQYEELVRNIMGDNETEDKEAALRNLTEEFIARLKQPPDATKDTSEPSSLSGALFKEIPQPDDDFVATEKDLVGEEKDSSLFVFKDKSGSYRVVATYSNNFRDEDNPSEIISKQSHEAFVYLVDQGLVDYPEGWHWHVPGSRWWKADWLAATDEGFVVASGPVDEGHEKEAAALAAHPEPIAVSHGMLKTSILRDVQDPSVIRFAVTREISDLPAQKAANKLTSFEVVSKELDMPISDEKKEYLKQLGLGDDDITAIDSMIVQRAKEGQAQGLESKEGTQAPAEPVKEGKSVEEPVGETAPATPSTAEVAEAIVLALTPLMTQVESLQTTVGELSSVVKELQVSDVDRIAKEASETPAASLRDLVSQSVLGKKEAQVDKRTTLGKSGPQETEQQELGMTMNPLVNDLIWGNQKALAGGGE